MNAAVKPKVDTAPLHNYLDKVRTLSHEGNYKAIAETYNAFLAEHPRLTYHATEPLAFLIGNHLVEKTGKSSAFSTMTIRNPTWTDKIVHTLKNPAEFQTFVEKLEADVNAIDKKI
jgi:hypothetical protein